MSKQITRGNRNINWIERYCRIPEGRDVAKPVKLRQWQRKEICRIYDNPAITRRAILSFGRKNAKGLALDTPIPTPIGWRLMGELRPGDFIFGSDGNPTRVLYVSDVHTNLRCWRLTFSDGSSVVADEQHLWLTRHSFRPWANPRKNGSGHGGRWITEIVNTPQIAESLMRVRRDGKREFNHKIQTAPSTQSPDIDLPIDPYVLGAWLGDGTTACASFTTSDEDELHLVSELENALRHKMIVARHSNRATTLRATGSGLQTALRKLGVLGNKHIPDIYFSSGTKQRFALLQGLMDTDGTVTRCAGRTTPRASFTGTNFNICQGVWRLARSLGFKATIREGEAKLNGRVTGRKYDVTFSASIDEPIFRLERKQSLLPKKLMQRSRTLTIVSCDEVASVPTRCIKVDAPDSLFLCGYGCVPTHNTTIAAFLLLLHLVGPEARANGQLYSAAQSREQASLLFNLASKCVRLSPDLSGVVKIRDTAKQLYCEELGTVYKALSAEASTAYGLSPSFIVHDELGQVKGPRSELYDALETATGAQDNPLSIIISTQAPTDADLLSVLIDDALQGHDPKTVVSLYTASMELDPFEEETIKLANPAFGDFLNAEEVKGMAESARRMPSREAQYRNLVLNQRVEVNNPFVTRAVWQGCGGEVADDFRGFPVYAGLDLSSVNDLTALVLIAPILDTWHIRSLFWLPEDGIVERAKKDRVPYDQWAKDEYIRLTPGKTVEYSFIAHELRELFDELNIMNIAFDRWNFKHLRRELINAGFHEDEIEGRFTEFGQGFASMSPALRTLESDLLNGKMRHGNNPVLTMCASNAVTVVDPSGNRKLAKDKSNGRIDGLVSLAMARSVAATYESNAEPTYQMIIV